MSDDLIGEDLFEDLGTLSDEDGTASITSTEDDAPTKEDVPSKEEPVIEEKEIMWNIPRLVGTDYPFEYKQVVDRFLLTYNNLPKLNFDELYTELAQLSVKSTPTSTLQMINLQLQKVQASKDRLAEIFLDVIRSFSFKKRAVNILTDAWGKFAEGTSADKRKSDCAFKLSDFQRDLAETEALHGTCEHVLKNLDSINNNLSRQITLIQSQLKLYDIGRGSLPDFDFNSKQLNSSFESLGDSVDNTIEEKTTKVEIDESESKDAEEMSF